LFNDGDTFNMRTIKGYRVRDLGAFFVLIWTVGGFDTGAT
jgi:hypothetical protein